MIYTLAKMGKLGIISEKYYERLGQLEEYKQRKMLESAPPLEIRISVPELQAKKAFLSVLEQVPVDENGDAITSGAKYEAWLNQARSCLLQRAVEVVIAYRSCEVMYLDTFCKYSNKLASERAWKQANDTRDGLQKELDDCRYWAGNLLKGWENGVIEQAVGMIDNNMQQQHNAQQQRMRQGNGQQQQQQQKQPKGNGKPISPQDSSKKEIS